jgi:hypothetical protein
MTWFFSVLSSNWSDLLESELAVCWIKLIFWSGDVLWLLFLKITARGSDFILEVVYELLQEFDEHGDYMARTEISTSQCNVPLSVWYGYKLDGVCALNGDTPTGAEYDVPCVQAER